MARKPIKQAKTHQPVEPKVPTAHAWVQKVFRETGKRVRLSPGDLAHEPE